MSDAWAAMPGAPTDESENVSGSRGHKGDAVELGHSQSEGLIVPPPPVGEDQSFASDPADARCSEVLDSEVLSSASGQKRSVESRSNREPPLVVDNSEDSADLHTWLDEELKDVKRAITMFVDQRHRKLLRECAKRQGEPERQKTSRSGEPGGQKTSRSSGLSEAPVVASMARMSMKSSRKSVTIGPAEALAGEAMNARAKKRQSVTSSAGDFAHRCSTGSVLAKATEERIFREPHITDCGLKDMMISSAKKMRKSQSNVSICDDAPESWEPKSQDEVEALARPPDPIVPVPPTPIRGPPSSPSMHYHEKGFLAKMSVIKHETKLRSQDSTLSILSEASNAPRAAPGAGGSASGSDQAAPKLGSMSSQWSIEECDEVSAAELSNSRFSQDTRSGTGLSVAEGCGSATARGSMESGAAVSASSTTSTRAASNLGDRPDDQPLDVYAASAEKMARVKQNFKSKSIFMDEDQTHPDSWAGKAVSSAWFEVVFGGLILANSVVMSLECQYESFGVGHELGIPDHHKSSEDEWPGMKMGFVVMDFFFGIVFAFEVCIKMFGLRGYFYHDRWNILDVVIVAGWLVDALSRNVVKLPFDATVLRSARLARLFRVLKLLKTLCRMDALFLMVTALRGSLAMLFWASVMLFTLTTLWALLINQIVVHFYLTVDDPADVQHRTVIFLYFGSFSRAIFTMFELTLGNFGPIARSLHENVSEWFMLFSMFHKVTVGFAVISIINGIFIQETFKVASLDDNVLVWQKSMARKMHAHKMRSFVNMADTSGTGRIDMDEFQATLAIEQVSTWLAAQGLDAECAATLFMLLDNDEEGYLTVEQIVNGVEKLKGSARSIDLAKLSMLFESLQDRMEDRIMDIHEAICTLSEREFLFRSSQASAAPQRSQAGSTSTVSGSQSFPALKAPDTSAMQVS